MKAKPMSYSIPYRTLLEISISEVVRSGHQEVCIFNGATLVKVGWPECAFPMVKREKPVIINKRPNHLTLFASNDTLPIKKHGGGSGGSKPNRPADLEAWLAAYDFPTGKFCKLEDQKRYKERMKGSELSRTRNKKNPPMKPSSLVYKQQKETPGWIGRPPTVSELFEESKTIAKRLGKYKADQETVDYVEKNIDSFVWRNPITSIEHRSKMSQMKFEMLKSKPELVDNLKSVKDYPNDKFLHLNKAFYYWLSGGKVVEKPQPLVSAERKEPAFKFYSLPILRDKDCRGKERNRYGDWWHNKREGVECHIKSFTPKPFEVRERYDVVVQLNEQLPYFDDYNLSELDKLTKWFLEDKEPSPLDQFKPVDLSKPLIGTTEINSNADVLWNKHVMWWNQFWDGRMSRSELHSKLKGLRDENHDYDSDIELSWLLSKTEEADREEVEEPTLSEVIIADTLERRRVFEERKIFQDILDGSDERQDINYLCFKRQWNKMGELLLSEDTIEDIKREAS